MGYCSYEQLLTNRSKCPHCHKSGYITYQSWPGTESMWHCNKCGVGWPAKKAEATEPNKEKKQ